jgi:hypothetical protein
LLPTSRRLWSTGTTLAGDKCEAKLVQLAIIKSDKMELGYFSMPSHPPECGLKEGNDWDLQVLRWLDELDFREAWIGENHTGSQILRLTSPGSH